MESPLSDRQRLVRQILLRTLRDLRRSVRAGRPMTLPNCLRLCRRRLAAASLDDRSVLDALATVYRRHQPFRGGWRTFGIERTA